eukprot:2342430-Rhodomonas_salina.2
MDRNANPTNPLCPNNACPSYDRPSVTEPTALPAVTEIEELPMLCPALARHATSVSDTHSVSSQVVCATLQRRLALCKPNPSPLNVSPPPLNATLNVPETIRRSCDAADESEPSHRPALVQPTLPSRLRSETPNPCPLTLRELASGCAKLEPKVENETDAPYDTASVIVLACPDAVMTARMVPAKPTHEPETDESDVHAVFSQSEPPNLIRSVESAGNVPSSVTDNTSD